MPLNPSRCNVLPILQNTALQAPNDYKLGQQSPPQTLNGNEHSPAPPPPTGSLNSFCNHALALCSDESVLLENLLTINNLLQLEKHEIYTLSQGLKRALKGGSYSHFPAQVLTKSHRPTAQIPSWLCLSCSNLNPIPIFYCFFVDESQSQCMKSHFPSQKMGTSQFPFLPLQDPL